MNNKICYALLSLCMLLVGCQQEDLFKDEVVENGDGNINFSISVPEELIATRATFGEKSNSACGGITNVDCATAYDLRYQLAVYRVEGDEFVEVIAPQKKVVDSYQPVIYSLRLTPNRNYKVMVWADFVKQGEDGDLHYDTQDFKNITCIDANDKQLNDESRDAYFITKDITVSGNGVNDELVLKRPFAKVRVVATDWNLYGLEMPDNFKITYYNCKRFTNINAVTGVSESVDLAADEATVYTGSINKDEKEYALNYDMSENNRTLTVDYLMTDKEEQTPIHMTFEALNGTTSIAKHDLKTNVPIQRNWLTTILGNILTVGAEFEISIDENFNNDWVVGEEWWRGQDINPVEPPYDEATKTYTVSTRDQFAWFSATDAEKTAEEGRTVQNAESLAGKTIVLANDIDMSGIDWQPIFTQGETTYTVDGQGHVLRNFSMNGKFGTVYVYSALGGLIKLEYDAYTGVWGKFEGVMKDLTFENITINGRADDEVHTDIDGNPVDHSKESAYFAGCIGYTGANYSTTVNIQNVHAKNVRIKASATTTQNVGGLIGWIGIGGGNTWLDGCSVENANLISGSQVGGLVGQVVSGRYVGIKNCKTDDITIRMTSKYTKSKSGFIGQINTGAGTEILNCTPPANVLYIDDATGEPVDYAPNNVYYGKCDANESSLKIE